MWRVTYHNAVGIVWRAVFHSVGHKNWRRSSLMARIRPTFLRNIEDIDATLFMSCGLVKQAVALKAASARPPHQFMSRKRIACLVTVCIHGS